MPRHSFCPVQLTQRAMILCPDGQITVHRVERTEMDVVAAFDLDLAKRVIAMTGGEFATLTAGVPPSHAMRRRASGDPRRRGLPKDGPCHSVPVQVERPDQPGHLAVAEEPRPAAVGQKKRR